MKIKLLTTIIAFLKKKRMKKQPVKISFMFKVKDGYVEVCYTDTGTFSSYNRPVYQVAAFLNKKGKPLGTYWGLVNKTNAYKYAMQFLSQIKTPTTD